jgi:hypothetical protein
MAFLMILFMTFFLNIRCINLRCLNLIFRIFWSGKTAFARTVYLFDIITLSDFESEGIIKCGIEDLDIDEFVQGSSGSLGGLPIDENSAVVERPVFRVVALDDTKRPIFTRDINKMLDIILQRVNLAFENVCGPTSCFAFSRKQRRYATDSYGLTPSIFFGLGLPWIR